jgi:hypothetical protein
MWFVMAIVFVIPCFASGLLLGAALASAANALGHGTLVYPLFLFGMVAGPVSWLFVGRFFNRRLDAPRDSIDGRASKRHRAQHDR